MFTLWYSILSYKEYRDVLSAPLIAAPSTPTVPASSTKPSAINLIPITPAVSTSTPAPTPPPTPAPKTPSAPVPSPATPSMQPKIRAPLLPPAKPPRAPSPHPLIRSDVLDDIDFEDEDLPDDDENEAASLAIVPPKTRQFGDAVNSFLQEEIRSGSTIPTRKEVLTAR